MPVLCKRWKRRRCSALFLFLFGLAYDAHAAASSPSRLLHLGRSPRFEECALEPQSIEGFNGVDPRAPNVLAAKRDTVSRWRSLFRKPQDYTGQWVWVVGGSEGIGRAMAEGFAKKGAHVIILARDAKKLNIALAGVEAARRDINQSAVSARLDVRRRTEVTKTIDALVQKHGVPDIMINSAGYAQTGFFTALPVAQLENMVHTNFLGTLRVSRAVLPHMQRARKGTLVNISSVAGFIPCPENAVYSAAKAAVMTLSQTLRNEVEPDNVKVKVICPPNVWTPGLIRENLTKSPRLLAFEQKARTIYPNDVFEALVKNLANNKFRITPSLDCRIYYLVVRLIPLLLLEKLFYPPQVPPGPRTLRALPLNNRSLFLTTQEGRVICAGLTSASKASAVK